MYFVKRLIAIRFLWFTQISKNLYFQFIKLHGLACGRPHDIFARCHNMLGASPDSVTLHGRKTLGGRWEGLNFLFMQNTFTLVSVFIIIHTFTDRKIQSRYHHYQKETNNIMLCTHLTLQLDLIFIAGVINNARWIIL